MDNTFTVTQMSLRENPVTVFQLSFSTQIVGAELDVDRLLSESRVTLIDVYSIVNQQSI